MSLRRTLVIAAAAGLCLAASACDGSKPLIRRDEKPVEFPAADRPVTNRPAADRAGVIDGLAARQNPMAGVIPRA